MTRIPEAKPEEEGNGEGGAGARSGIRNKRSPSELRAQLALAIPLALQQLGMQLMGTVDAALLGHYSKTSLAAAGIGNNVLFAISSIGLGIIMGLDSVVPQAIGAGRLADARRLLDAGIRLAIAVGLAATLVVVASPYALGWLDLPPEVVGEARLYISIRALGIVPFLVSIALRTYLAARGRTSPLVIAVLVGNIANAGIDLVLIFGLPAIGLPPLGVIGAAIATLFVQILICIVYLVSARALDEGPRPRGTRADARQIARYGLPVGGQLFAEIGIFGVATMLAAYLGTIPAAAHSIALNLASFTFAVAVGVGSATSVRVGHAIGAGDRALARRRGGAGLLIGLVTMGACAVVLVGLPRHVASIFTTDREVIAATIPLLQIAALFQLSDGAQAIGAGALRGLGDTRATFVGNVVGHYAIGLPISLVLAFHVGQGAPGLWWGLSAGLTITAFYLVARFVANTRVSAKDR